MKLIKEDNDKMTIEMSSKEYLTILAAFQSIDQEYGGLDSVILNRTKKEINDLLKSLLNLGEDDIN